MRVTLLTCFSLTLLFVLNVPSYVVADSSGSAQPGAPKGKLIPNYVDAPQHRSMRAQKIRLFRQVLRSGVEKSQRATILYQLAELLWKQSKSLGVLAQQKHNAQMTVWDRECRVIGDPRKCPRPPKPDRKASIQYQSASLKIYRKLLQQFPKYARRYEVRFLYADNLLAAKQTKEAIKQYQTLIRSGGDSRYVLFSQSALGNFFFQSNKMAKSIHYFKQALTTGQKILSRSKQKPIHSQVSGTVLRSHYYLGWCFFNEGNFSQALKRFKLVVQLSGQYKTTFKGRVSLSNEALRDLVLVYAKLNVTDKAYRYFRKIKGPRFAHIATRRLARRYYQLGSYFTAMKVFRLLINTDPMGQKGKLHANVPLLQNEVVRACTRVCSLSQLRKEFVLLFSYLEPKHPWYKKWSRKKKTWQEVNERAEQTTLEFSTKYHQHAQREKVFQKRGALYLFAAFLYEKYVKFFPTTESVYELQFFLAEVQYHWGGVLLKRAKRENKSQKRALKLLRRACYHYRKLLFKKKRYKKVVTFAWKICLEKKLAK